MHVSRRSMVGAALGAALLGQRAWAQPGSAGYTPQVGQVGKDVVWVPTSQALVNRMLDMAGLTPQDRLVDLGSGDGRLVITAAKRGAIARGIEYNPDMVALSRRAAAAEGVAARATFEQADIFESNFSEATVVTLFLLPNLNMRLRPTLLNMPAGTRVLSNSFTMEDWQPDDSFNVVEGCSGYCNALKWVVPAKVGGTWQLGDQRLTLMQRFQRLEGSLGSDAPLLDARLDGPQIRFTAGGRAYTGQVAGRAMRGTVDGAAWTATQVS
ncbi:class I SAM-dependent methyltransferase [Pseudorhodoferax sp. Leaf267]|uniref:class I SAM-dependent methyltransferase n=1 Tax=Pseudorhodoferax sp. Leaf267 TaxID=1736316 RepID=UPI0006F62DD3|nr:class I SAM-dependent methyltransferase [Pseudorhodoferax sp. Leaf267]KQP22363.1 RNA methyltransferase [Pseudorhodoferax sp. Leaf267]